MKIISDGNSILFLLTRIKPKISPIIKIITIRNTKSTIPSPINWNACSWSNIIRQSLIFFNNNILLFYFNVYKLFLYIYKQSIKRLAIFKKDIYKQTIRDYLFLKSDNIRMALFYSSSLLLR